MLARFFGHGAVVVVGAVVKSSESPLVVKWHQIGSQVAVEWHWIGDRLVERLSSGSQVAAE